MHFICINYIYMLCKRTLEIFNLATLKLYTHWETITNCCLLSPWKSQGYVLFLWILLVQVPHTNGIIQLWSFTEWFISCSVLSSRTIHVVEQPQIFEHWHCTRKILQVICNLTASLWSQFYSPILKLR